MQNRREESKAQWMNRIARGTNEQKDYSREIPVYGEIKPPLDSDEKAFLSLSTKFTTMPIITEEDTQFKGTYGNVKIR